MEVFMSESFIELCKILFLCHKNMSFKTVAKDNAKIHRAIYNIKKSNNNLFKDLTFDESTIYPFSDELEDMLYGLELGEVLSTPNSEYKKYSIQNVDYLEKISDSCKFDMNKETQQFCKEVGVS
jgi:hypothetical protein